MSLYPRVYQPGPIEPIVDTGQNLLLQQKQSLFKLYRVNFVEPIPPSVPVTVNLQAGGLNAATTTSGISTGATPVSLANQEDMPDGELFQARFRVLDPVSVTLWQGQGLGRDLTKVTQATYTMWSYHVDPHAAFSEHFVWEQNRAYMIATNYLARAVGQVRVMLWGFRFVIEGVMPQAGRQGGTQSSAIVTFTSVAEAEASNYKFTIVPTQGWSS